MTGRPILRLKKPAQPAPGPAPAPAPTLTPAAYVAPMPLRVSDILGVLEPLFEPVGERMLPWFPYTVGIVDALVADTRFRPGDDPAAAHELVRTVIARVTGTGAYLRSLARPGARRHDINGAPVEAVSEAHREHALRRLAEREKKRAASRR